MRVNLQWNEEQELLRQSFAELFAAESSPARVRAAEPLGFDRKLWDTLAQTGALGIRVPEARGGSGAGLLDAALLAEQAGRHLASGPLLESIAAAALLARCDGDAAGAWLERALDGSGIVTLALRAEPPGTAQLVPGGAVADAVVGLDGEDLVLVERRSGAAIPTPSNLGSAPLGLWTLSGGPETLSGGPEVGARHVLARGERARREHGIACEEWKLLCAAALGGLAHRALEIAAEYASGRIQFDRPIASFQGIAHPLADAVTAVEGGQLLVWEAIWAIGRHQPDAAQRVSMAFAWAAESASVAVARALHTHGGYGLSLEYDIQLYHRRGKAWALAGGDPRDELQRVAGRRWGGEAQVALPEAGEATLEFGLGPRAEQFRLEARRFFEENLVGEFRAHARHDWDGHHPVFQRKLAEAGLAFASWPPEYGGQGRDPYEMTALGEEFHRAGWTMHAIGTTRLVGETLLRLASEELKREVLPRICAGDAVISLGYTEPGSGSDVAAAQTRAVRDGDQWVINGQKIFTSGANVSQYVFLLTRTDPGAPKHRGLTMFLVPLDSPGVEIQPIRTLSDERTNATYYTDVRIPDRYRVGEVNGGWSVLRYALDLEHGAGGMSGFEAEHRAMVERAAAWARSAPRGDGSTAFDDARVRERLAHAAVQVEVSRLLGLRSLWTGVEHRSDRGEGPMAKLFGAEAYIRDASDLMDLAAPDSLLKPGEPGAAGDGHIEFSYRLSTAMSIYGGTSEIMRSLIAQATLGMPRSRS
jgi:alkylation response protein AidB-like acyl-CoA dehydrogenase